MHTVRTLVRLMALVVLGGIAASCASTSTQHVYQLYPGRTRPDAEVAVVIFGDAVIARFDGMLADSTDWTEVRLAPGQHHLQWSYRRGDNWSPASGKDPMETFQHGYAVLEAGHTYSLRWDQVGFLVDETTARRVPVKEEPAQ